MNFIPSSLFQTINPTTFKYYELFISIYILSLILSIGLIIYRKKTKKNFREFKKTLRILTDYLFLFGIIGLFLLFARYANIYFISMEFFHILNIIIFATIISVKIKHFIKINK